MPGVCKTDALRCVATPRRGSERKLTLPVLAAVNRAAINKY